MLLWAFRREEECRAPTFRERPSQGARQASKISETPRRLCPRRHTSLTSQVTDHSAKQNGAGAGMQRSKGNEDGTVNSQLIWLDMKRSPEVQGGCTEGCTESVAFYFLLL